MKKKIVMLISAVLGILVLTGCNSAGGSEETAASEASEELTLYVVRHGKTMLNTADRVQGWADAPLIPSGAEVVKAAGIGLKDVDFQTAYSSDSGRAIETAEVILAENVYSSKKDVQKDQCLREFNFGTYEGDLNETMWEDVAHDQGKEVEAFREEVKAEPGLFPDSLSKVDKGRDEEGLNIPAEDYAAITERLSAGIEDIVANESKKDGSKNVLVVSHGFSILGILDILFDEEEVNLTDAYNQMKNASVTVIKYKDGKYTLDKLCDLSYAEKGQKEMEK